MLSFHLLFRCRSHARASRASRSSPDRARKNFVAKKARRFFNSPKSTPLLSLNGPGGSPGHEWGAWRGLLALSTSNVWIVHVDSPCGQPTWTSAGDHHLRWLNLQEKVGRGTLDLELSLDSYSGAPRGSRASPGPQLGLQRNVTNLMKRGSKEYSKD